MARLQITAQRAAGVPMANTVHYNRKCDHTVIGHLTWTPILVIAIHQIFGRACH
jgi:hypothetical protein